VLVNRHVAAADYVIGIGGVYPQNSTGFGGGAKLALGVLGRRSIVNLHYGYKAQVADNSDGSCSTTSSRLATPSPRCAAAGPGHPAADRRSQLR
jgi:nickel-dependent lactate racemase